MVAAAYGPPKQKIFSIDSSVEWVKIVKNNASCEAKVAAGLLSMEHVDVGPIGEWGVPVGNTARDRWHTYSQAISKHQDVKFDVVLVDGRFRIACVIHSFLSNPDAIVLIHDFFEPHHHETYKKLLSVADVVARAGTLVQLKKKSEIKSKALKHMYVTHITDTMR